jgi:NAD(P)-dependent dehydrogenase (short-subunit alcohol dehydrogenase family)
MTKLTLTDIDDLRAYERQRDEFRRRVIAVKKLRRIHVGRPAQGDDIARTAAFLCSAESDYLTGLSISVSGGMGMD